MAIYPRIDQEELIWSSFLGKVRIFDIFDILVGKVDK